MQLQTASFKEDMAIQSKAQMDLLVKTVGPPPRVVSHNDQNTNAYYCTEAEALKAPCVSLSETVGRNLMSELAGGNNPG